MTYSRPWPTGGKSAGGSWRDYEVLFRHFRFGSGIGARSPSAVSRGHHGSVGAHGLAEMYAALTRTPFTPAIYPSEAWQILEATILPHLEPIALSASAYKHRVQDCATAGWIGGRVYDLIHVRCAQKVNWDRLYTFNVKDFRALAPDDFRDRVCAP